MIYRRTLKFLLLMVLGFVFMPGLKAQSDTLKIPRVGKHAFTPVTYSKLPLYHHSFLYTHWFRRFIWPGELPWRLAGTGTARRSNLY